MYKGLLRNDRKVEYDGNWLTGGNADQLEYGKWYTYEELKSMGGGWTFGASAEQDMQRKWLCVDIDGGLY